MPLDPRLQQFLKSVAAAGSPGIASLGIEERRAGLERLLEFSGAPQAVEQVEDRAVPGAECPLDVRIYTPRAAAAGPLPGLIFFHGGGLVAGTLNTHDTICRALANASGCRIMAVAYRLAPEHPFPAAIADGVAASNWIAAHAEDFGLDPRRLAVGGDSAGATLAAVVCQAPRPPGATPWALQFLLCPITDFAAESESRRNLGAGYLLDRATLAHDLKYYLPAAVAPDDPRVSPLRAASIAQVPPACIHTAEFDPLRDEGKAYADRLSLAGIRTTYRCHPGMIHLFYGLGGLVSYVVAGIKLMGDDIRAMLA